MCNEWHSGTALIFLLSPNNSNLERLHQFSPGQSVIHSHREIKQNKIITKFINVTMNDTLHSNMQLRHRPHLIPDIGLTLYSRHRATWATLIVLYFLFCEPRRNQFLLSGGSRKSLLLFPCLWQCLNFIY